MEELTTYIFVMTAGVSSLLLLFTKNVMHGVYLLMAILLSIAVLFIQLNAEFIGVAQLMVYVGGILILLLFGIMLTNRITGDHIVSETQHTVIGILIGIVLTSGLCLLASDQVFSFPESTGSNSNNIKGLGQQLMTDYILEFEIVGVILLLVLIGAAFIAKYTYKSDKDEYIK